MTHRKDVVTFEEIMANVDQIPKGDLFARGIGPVDPLRERAMANALRMQTRRAADDLRRQIEAIDSMPWKELRDSLRLALVELAEVKPALHDALCERDEAKAHVVCLEALLREKTEECDELDEERREAWQHVQNNMSHVLLKRAHGALADAGDVPVPELHEHIDGTIRAIVRERDEERMRVRCLEQALAEAQVDPHAISARLRGVICSFDVDGQMVMVPGESVAKTLITLLEPSP